MSLNTMKLTEKKRKVSKKTKRSWRKHIDTKDIDVYLESVRFDERLGTPFSERLDSELFVVDQTSTQVAPLSTKQQRRQALKNTEPQCFAVLTSRSAVPDPITKRNRVRTPEERKDPLRKLAEAKRKLNGVEKLKERLAKKNKVLAQAKRNARYKKGEFHSDIWEEAAVPSQLHSQWLSNDTVRHTLANTGQNKKKIRVALYKKPISVVPAVELPHPGISYNPSYSDHQELLTKIAQNEKKLMREEAHLNRVTTLMFKKVSAAERNEKWMKEISEGLPLNPENKVDDTDGEENDGTIKSVNPPVKNKKKTLVTRRKQKEQKELARKRTHEKIEKKKIADIYKLNKLKNQLANKEKKETILREKRLKVKERKATEPKTLSRIKFEAAEPDFKMESELSGNLRNAEPAGNLLKDRYKSLQQRNILAPAVRILKRNKGKVKRFQKPDHKVVVEDTFKK